MRSAGYEESSSPTLPSQSVDLAGTVLILSGPPGSGKTTIAKLLASQPGSSKVHIHADDFWRNIKFGAFEPWLADANRQNEVVVEALASASEIYAKGGYLVVLDGIIGPWFLGPFQSLSVPVHYLVLNAPLDVALDRCRVRGGDQLSEQEPIGQLHAQFADLGEFNHHVVSNNGLDEHATLLRVINALNGGQFLLGS